MSPLHIFLTVMFITIQGSRIDGTQTDRFYTCDGTHPSTVEEHPQISCILEKCPWFGLPLHSSCHMATAELSHPLRIIKCSVVKNNTGELIPELQELCTLPVSQTKTYFHHHIQSKTAETFWSMVEYPKYGKISIEKTEYLTNVTIGPEGEILIVFAESLVELSILHYRDAVGSLYTWNKTPAEVKLSTVSTHCGGFLLSTSKLIEPHIKELASNRTYVAVRGVHLDVVVPENYTLYTSPEGTMLLTSLVENDGRFSGGEDSTNQPSQKRRPKGRARTAEVEVDQGSNCEELCLKKSDGYTIPSSPYLIVAEDQICGYYYNIKTCWKCLTTQHKPIRSYELFPHYHLLPINEDDQGINIIKKWISHLEVIVVSFKDTEQRPLIASLGGVQVLNHQKLHWFLNPLNTEIHKQPISSSWHHVNNLWHVWAWLVTISVFFLAITVIFALGRQGLSILRKREYNAEQSTEKKDT